MSNKKESNLLIARFVGLEILEQPIPRLSWAVYDGVCQSIKYHCDWNWIMSAVKKIDSIMLDQPIVTPLEELADDVFRSLREVNPELTQELIVKFVNQHNVMALGSVRHIRLYNKENHLSLEGAELDTLDESEVEDYLAWYGRKTVNNQIN